MLRDYSGPVFILVAATLWAFDGLIRQHLYSLPPITIIFFEHLIGLLLLTPFVWKMGRGSSLGRREVGLLVVIALLSGLLGTLWFTTALGKVGFISLSVVFLLQKLQPIFAILSARVFLNEKFERRYFILAPLALVSAYFVTFPNGQVNLSTGDGTALAALYALGSAFAWGTSTTFSKMLLGKVSPEQSTFYRFIFTLLLAFPILLLFGYGGSLGAVTVPQYGWLLLIALSTGMVALLLYYKGLSRTPVHITTILELTFPFIAIMLDFLVNGTVLSVSQWIGAIVLVLSIYQTTKLQKNYV